MVQAVAHGDDGNNSPFVLPDTGDEVVVGFEGGDGDSPIVLGNPARPRTCSIEPLGTLNDAQTTCVASPGLPADAADVDLSFGQLAFSECSGLGIFPDNALLQFADGYASGTTIAGGVAPPTSSVATTLGDGTYAVRTRYSRACGRSRGRGGVG